MEDNENMMLDWGSEISDDGSEFILLKPGEYEFTVSKMERGVCGGTGKVAGCKKAMLTLEIESEEGTAYVKDDIILYKSLEWKISEFFRCIGMKKKGEAFRPKWDSIIGKTGRVKIKVETFMGKDSEEKQKNAVAKYLDPVEPAKENDFTEVKDDEMPF